MEGLIWLAIPIIAAIWVYNDANTNGVTAENCSKIANWLAIGPGVWALLTFLLLIVGLPAYLIVRERVMRLNIPQGSSAGVNGKKKCPFCAELVQLEARLCKHCGSKI